MESFARYTVEHGLKVLRYLGLQNITSDEEEIFRQNWDKYYSSDIIGTIKILYTTVAILTNSRLAHFTVPIYRKAIFSMQIKRTRISEELRSGIRLEDIIEKEPHKLF